MDKNHIYTVVIAVLLLAVIIDVNLKDYAGDYASMPIGYMSANPKGSQDVETVTVAYLPVVQSLPLYLAIDKGYFKDEGLDVKALKIDSPNLIFDALISGQADFGAPGTAAGITGITNYVKPGELEIFELVGGGNSTTNDLLLVGINSSIDSISGLKGHKLGILPGIQFRTIAKDILAQNGLSDKDVTIVELAPGLQPQALASGQVDAILSIEPTGTIVESKGIGRELVHAPMVKYISDPWYGAVGVVKTKYATEHPETARKVISVLAKATEEIRADPASAKKHLVGYTPLDENMAEDVPLPEYRMYDEVTGNDILALQKFLDIFHDFGVINGTVNAQAMMYAP